MNEVAKWFSSGAEVNEGLRLLSIYAPNRNLDTLVRRCPERFKRFLLKELERFADSLPSGPPQPQRSKFREQWPFLSDPSCPMELKALAADKITAYQNVCDLHEKLYECTDLEICFETAKNLLTNFTQNLKITAEFAYFKEHRRMLGKHPIFKERKELEKYTKLGPFRLAKEQHRLEGAIWRVKSEMKKGDKPQLDEERKRRLAQKERELAVVNDLIEQIENK